MIESEKDRIRQRAIDKLEARMCGDGDLKMISSPLLTLPGDDFDLNEAIKYFPKFLRYALRCIFIFPEAVKCYTTIIAQSNNKQNMVINFNKECESCVLLVGNILERLSLFNPQEELDFLDKYESWCEKVKKQLHDELAAMEQNETMNLSLIHRALKLKKERDALAEQLQIFVGRIIGRIIRDIEREQNRGQRKKDIQDKNETNKPVIIVKEPFKEAQQAYQLYYGSGIRQVDVAQKMADKLKRPVSQGQVSRWVKEYKEWRKAEGISIDDKKPNIITNSNILDKGARTDGRITGDPRHKKNTDFGDND